MEYSGWKTTYHYFSAAVGVGKGSGRGLVGELKAGVAEVGGRDGELSDGVKAAAAWRSCTSRWLA